MHGHKGMLTPLFLCVFLFSWKLSYLAGKLTVKYEAK